MKRLIRISTAGSVDDGKSTLIGRLLHASNSIYQDHWKSVQGSSQRGQKQDPQPDGDQVEWAHLTDGLKSEREQGITIDVAHRYFSTARRKFIVADTPGHIDYTRNMATGASTADVALILLDAQKGIQVQSMRHALIAALLGIPHLLIVINKMDLVDYCEDRYLALIREFQQRFRGLPNVDLKFIPISALAGDLIVNPSERMPWYRGPDLMEYLETVPVLKGSANTPIRFPVQHVIRPDASFRGYAGTLVSGTLKPGDPLLVLPSNKRTRVASIHAFDGELEHATTRRAVSVTLEDELDISRGDVLVDVHSPSQLSSQFRCAIVWLSEQSLEVARTYYLKSNTQSLRARISRVSSRMNLEQLEPESHSELGLNDIGHVELETLKPLVWDPYLENKTMGSFILIDPLNNQTVAAGLLCGTNDPIDRMTRVSDLTQKSTGSCRALAVYLTGEGDHGSASHYVDRFLAALGMNSLILDSGRHPEALGRFARDQGLSVVWMNSDESKFGPGSISLSIEGKAPHELEQDFQRLRGVA